MTKVSKQINLGKGLGGLLFGVEKNAVSDILGTPDEVEQYTDEETEEVLNEAWHYDEMELSLSFDKEEEWKLCTISVSDADFTLNGEQLIGATEETLIEFIEAQKLGEFEKEEWSLDDDETQMLITIESQSINFWFTEGIVTEIQWGPLYTEDNTTIWPN